MDHFLEDEGEFGKDLGLQFWRQASPEVSEIGGHGWHKTSSASATEISSCKAAKVSFVETLGWAEARLVAASGIRNAMYCRYRTNTYWASGCEETEIRGKRRPKSA
jgi:hypothetical protein